MSTNLEIEAKVLLAEEDYQKINNLNLAKPYIQINYYFDNKDHTFSKIYGLRIRYKNDKYELTLKEKCGDGQLETNQPIDERQFLIYRNTGIFILGEVKNKLLSLGIDVNSLFIFGEVKTTRIDFTYDTSLFSLDKNEYNGIIDYELEAEDSSIKSSKKNIVTFLTNNDINFTFNNKTKLQRLVESLAKR